MLTTDGKTHILEVSSLWNVLREYYNLKLILSIYSISINITSKFSLELSLEFFKVPQKKFHELRFNVAMVLKEMELLENSRYLSIADSNWSYFLLTILDCLPPWKLLVQYVYVG